MLLAGIDWVIIGIFFVIILAIGIIASRKVGDTSADFFLSGRSMPFWLLGISMVATTFSTDTPNLVTDLVRNYGVSGNWLWWAFLLTGMLTVFVYTKLWRRSNVMTDIEFYEIRYSGKSAAFLRGFRAVYLGFFFNVMIMATVSLAAIKIGSVLLNTTPLETISVALLITVIYAGLGGLRSVLFTDLFLFSFAMFGAVAAAVVAVSLPEVGGLSGLFSHPNVADKLSLLPDFNDPQTLIIVFIIPIAVQWWSVWYPGAEPGGGGYLVQRMLSAKNEKHAMGATLFFNVAHYAIRPWPWILVALASLIIYPDLATLQSKFPQVDPSILKDDLAYPAMLTFLPVGVMGIVVASLIAAYMSTMASQLNWGSSYLVNDVYRRFIKPEATEKELVKVGRISTVVLMLTAGTIALFLQNALQAFHILLQIGAGTGLIFILRWFWWRINAMTELAGMIASFVLAVYFEMIHENLGFLPMESHVRLIVGVAITTIIWLAVTFWTKPTDNNTLIKFYKLIRPGGRGWDKVIEISKQTAEPITKRAKQGDLARGIVSMIAGTFLVYGIVFSSGYFLYGQLISGVVTGVVALAGGIVLYKNWGKIEML